jgi:hypothetical protein
MEAYEAISFHVTTSCHDTLMIIISSNPCRPQDPKKAYIQERRSLSQLHKKAPPTKSGIDKRPVGSNVEVKLRR